LIAAAKKEGRVVWYTTLIVNQAVRPLAKAFEEKYPGIEVRYSRADSGPTALKILNEARAVRLQADVFDGSGTVPPLVRAGLVAAYLPPTAASYPPELKDPDGHWICTNLYFLTPGINTSLVPREAAPRTLQDLLDPRWRGRIAWSTSSTAGGGTFIGTVLRRLGEDGGLAYLRALARQQIVAVDASSRAVLDQVITGEYAMALGISRRQGRTGRLAETGADRRADSGGEPPQGGTASQCRQAAARISHLRGGPAHLRQRRLPSGDARHRGQGSLAQARCRRLCRRHSPSRSAGAKYRSMDDDLQGAFSLGKLRTGERSRQGFC
jgi:hypothetical protein